MNAAPEIEVAGQVYQIGKLSAMVQFHVVRRIGPVLAAMGVSMSSLEAEGKKLATEDDVLGIMGIVSEVVAKMSNEDVEYVIFSCLAVVRRQQQERYMPVLTGKNFQFQDIDMNVMMRLTVEVLKENLGNFFPMPRGGADTSQG